MKKIFTLIMITAVAFTANAQQKHYAGRAYHSTVVPRPITEEESRLSLEEGDRNLAAVSYANREILFSEEFSNGFNGANAFGPWVVEDSGGNSIWMVATDQSPAGAYSTGTAALNSTTKTNGWIIFDADFYQGGEISDLNPAETVFGYLTSPVMDLSSAGSAILSFQHYFRFCCADAKPMYLEVTNDAGLNWFAFDVAPDFIGGANDASSNPVVTTLDISGIAAGQSAVQFRFAWQPDGNIDHSHYFWGIDDVVISSNDIVNDAQMVACTSADIVSEGGFQYRAIPLEQAIPADAGGVMVGAFYTNKGTAIQNATVKVEILDETMNVLAADSIEIELLPNSLIPVPNDQVDSVYISTGWEPTAIGKYFARASIRIENDEVMENNSMIREFSYTEDEYGHDIPTAATSSMIPVSGQGTASDPYPPTGFGSYFTFFNDGSSAYGTSIRFSNQADNETSVSIVLIERQEDYNLTDGVFKASKDYSIDPSWTPNFPSQNYPIYLPFNTPASLIGGSQYFAGIINQSESTSRLAVRANREFDEDFSTGVWAQTVDDDFIWFFGLTDICDFTPAIRLVTSERVGIDEKKNFGLNAFTVNPNPASQVANLNFELQGSHYVAFEVRDITGKLMDWNNIGQYSGSNTHQIDVSAYPVGQYIVRIVIDGEHLVPMNMQVIR